MSLTDNAMGMLRRLYRSVLIHQRKSEAASRYAAVTAAAMESLEDRMLLSSVVSVTPDVPVINDSVAVGGTFSYAVEFNEAMDTGSTPDIAFFPGILDTLVPTGGFWSAGDTIYTATYTVADVEVEVDPITVTVSGAIGTITGALDPFDGEAAGFAIDTLSPAIDSETVPADGDYGTGETLTFTITWDEAVTVTGAPRLHITIGGVPQVAIYAGGDGTDTLTFMYEILTDDDGVLAVDNTIDLNGGTIRDAVGNDADLVADFASTAGVNVASVPSITSDEVPADGEYKAGEDLTFTVTWDEAVTVTGVPQLNITIGGVAQVAAYAGGDGTDTLTFTYTIQAGDDGVLAVDNTIDLNGGTIQDAGGNDADLVADFASTAGVNVDTTAPAIDSETVPADGDYLEEQDLTFTVTWDEAVTVTGVPQLNITIGGVPQVALYTFGSGTSTLTFTYTTRVGDIGVLAVDNTIDLNGGTIRDAAGNDADLVADFASTAGVNVDAVAPEVDTVTPSLTEISEGNVGVGTFTYTVTFSKAMNPAFEPTIAFSPDIASTLTFTGGVWSAGDTVYTATYDVADGNVEVDPITVTISGVVDLVGNALVAFENQAAGFVIDTRSPAIDSETVPADGGYKAGEDLTFTVTWDEAVIVTGVPQLNITIGGVPQVAAYAGGDGTDTLTFTYTIQAGDEGVLAVDNTIDLNGGTIQDAVGNDADLVADFASTADVNVDTEAPIVTLDIAPLENNLGYVIDTTPLLQGTIDDPTATITLTITSIPLSGGTPVVIVAAGINDGAGGWTYQVPAELASMNFTVVVTATDAAGNEGEDEDVMAVRTQVMMGSSLVRSLLYYGNGEYNEKSKITVKVSGSGSEVNAYVYSEGVLVIKGKTSTKIANNSAWTYLDTLEILENTKTITISSREYMTLGTVISDGAGLTTLNAMRAVIANGIWMIDSVIQKTTIAGVLITPVFDGLVDSEREIVMTGTYDKGITIDATAYGFEDTLINLPNVGIKSFRAGVMVDTDLFVGVDNFDRSVLPDPTMDLTPDLFITKLDILGSKMYNKYADWFMITNNGDYSGSNIAASVLGSISLKNVDLDNDGTDFGVAGNALTKYLKVKQKGEGTYNWDTKWFADAGDLVIDIQPV